MRLYANSRIRVLLLYTSLFYCFHLNSSFPLLSPLLVSRTSRRIPLPFLLLDTTVVCYTQAKDLDQDQIPDLQLVEEAASRSLTQTECDHIIAQCVANDEWDLVLQMLETMKQQNLKQVRSTYHACLRECRERGNAASAQEILNAMTTAGYPPNVTDVQLVVSTMMCQQQQEEDWWKQATRIIMNDYDNNETFPIEMYDEILAKLTKEREWKDAIVMLRSMERKGVQPVLSSFELVIECCVQANQPEQAVQVLQSCIGKGLVPSSRSFESVILLLSKRLQWRRAKQLIETMTDLKVRKSLILYNAVITACAKAGEVSQAKNLLVQMKKNNIAPDIVSYNSVIACCAKNGFWKQALAMLDQCQREGVVPDIYTYTNAMRACAKGGKTERALNLFQVVKDKRLQLDAYAYTAAIEACAKAGLWRKSLELLQEMEKNGIEPTSVTYSVTITACGNGGNWEMALQLLDQMRDKNLSINLITYNSAITALSKAAKKISREGSEPVSLWKLVLGILRKMDEDGIEPDGFSYSSAISCCGAEGRWEEALKLIETMQKGGPRARPNKIAYTAAISSCGRAGQADEAFRLFKQMRDQGISADQVAYNALFAAFRVASKADDAYELWKEMVGEKEAGTSKFAVAKFSKSTQPDVITITDAIGAFASGKDELVSRSRVDEVFSEAVKRQLVLTDNSLDSTVGNLEYDLTGMSFPVARAACRYIVKEVIERIRNAEDVQDLAFITGVGRTTSDASYTSLRDYIQEVLLQDFAAEIPSEVPKFAQGTVVITKDSLQALIAL